MGTVRKDWTSLELTKALTALNVAQILFLNGVVGSAKLAAGTTNGKIKTVAAVDFRIAGRLYTKAITDDLWDFTAETTLASGTYKAAVLYLDASGTASYALTAAKSTAAAALLAVRDLADGGYVSTKSIIGVYVSTAAQNWTGALGGTYYNGFPMTALSSVATDPAGVITFINT